MNAVTMSICIPSLNRKDYLLQALHSVLDGTKRLDRIEICISNNCSDENYDEVERLVRNKPLIKYIRQSERIPLDQNMHFSAKMASGAYVYFLGDDDYFFEGSVDRLTDLIDREGPDLVIMNGLNVDEAGAPMKRLFSCPDGIRLDHFNDAYTFHNANCMFGAVLVKKEYLVDSVFEKFYGTSHGYMSFWATLATKVQAEPDCPIKVMTPKDPIVALRQAKKTYASYFLDALYEHMPLWYSIFQGFVHEASMKAVVTKCVDRNYQHLFSWKFMASLKLLGLDIDQIGTYASAKRMCCLPIKLAIIRVVPDSTIRWVGKLVNIAAQACGQRNLAYHDSHAA